MARVSRPLQAARDQRQDTAHVGPDVYVKREGSEVTNCYVTVRVGGNVGRIASAISAFVSHFCAEGMVLCHIMWCIN